MLGLLLVSVLISTPVLAKDKNKDWDKDDWQERKATIVQTMKNKAKTFNMAARINGSISNLSTNSFQITKDGKTYTINITDKTKLVRRYGAKSSLSEFSNGDMVNVVGKWTDENKTTIEATMVRDISIQKRNANFVGKIISISGNTFVIDPVSMGKYRKGQKTIYPATSATYKNRRMETITLADMKVGHRVRVSGGTWNRVENKIFDVTKIVDISIPPVPTKNPTPTPTP